MTFAWCTCVDTGRQRAVVLYLCSNHLTPGRGASMFWRIAPIVDPEQVSKVRRGGDPLPVL